jgi:hypothetical protein
MVPQQTVASGPAARSLAAADAFDPLDDVPDGDGTFPDLTLTDVRVLLAGSADAVMSPEALAAACEELLDPRHRTGGCPPCLAAAGMAFDPAWTKQYCPIHALELEWQRALRQTGHARTAALRVLELAGRPASCASMTDGPENEPGSLYLTLVEESGKAAW